MIINIVTIVLFVIALLIIIVGFLMAPDSNSFSGAIVGSSDLKLFSQTKEQSWKKILKWTMISLGFIMIITTIIIRIYI